MTSQFLNDRFRLEAQKKLQESLNLNCILKERASILNDLIENRSQIKENQFIKASLVDIDTDGQLRFRPSHYLVWSEGKICSIESSRISISKKYPNAEEITFKEEPFLFPGAIDCHIHFPQTKIIGGYGNGLLDWLDKNVWPEEKKFIEEKYATSTANFFFKNLLKAGTTTALVFGSQFESANNILFRKAEEIGFGLISGMTLQNRNTVPELEQSIESIKESSARLIQKWHLKNRLRYAVTPRFSPACSSELLRLCGDLLSSKPQIYMQTHINESLGEISFVKDLFPEAKDYLSTYEDVGLLSDRSVFAHSIHTKEQELIRLGQSNCSVAHCPSSNSFLGSGTFSFQAHHQHHVKVGMGTDVGAGISFSLWREAGHAHLIQMRKEPEHRFLFDGRRALKAITIDSAKALSLESETGSFEVGKWADFNVLCPSTALYTGFSQSDNFFSNLDMDSLNRMIFQMSIRSEENLFADTFVSGRSGSSFFDN